MYRECDEINGMGGRVYRSITEIREDIREIGAEIKEARERLNLRYLLVDLLDAMRDGLEPDEWMPTLEETYSEAEDAFNTLTELTEELTGLREELSDTKWAMGI